MDTGKAQNILVIDSDRASQEAMQTFFAARSCRVCFAGDEASAYKVIDSTPLSLVIVEILSDNLKGLDSLKNIAKKAAGRKTPVIVVSSHTKSDDIAQCVALGAKDFIAKPLNDELFAKHVSGVMSLPELGGNTDAATKPVTGIVNELAEKLKTDDLDFSVMPQLGYKIIELLKDEKAPLAKVSELIEKDPGIFSKILKAANSPVFAAAKPVYNSKEAILRIGVKRTINYILVVSSSRLFKTPDKTYEGILKEVLDHSLTCAIVAREIGHAINYPEADNLFAYGLLHDIGKVLLLRILKEVAEERNITDTIVIKDLLEKLHTRFGASLVKKWNLPKEFFEAILYHHDKPDRAKHSPTVVLVSIANMIAHEIEDDTLKTNMPQILRQPHLAMLGLKNPKFDTMKSVVMKEKSILKGLAE
ncbi:MAG: HDOD domain-containing protein [Gammaproteobacteria bacterium]|nr:HDOD domain-containing protein [Gammaproteobacteria bacterium]